MEPRSLTAKETRFIDIYTQNGFDAMRAALEVYDITGENAERTASAMASTVLSREIVKQEVAKRLGDLKDNLKAGLTEAIAIARKWLCQKNDKKQEFAMKYLQTLAPLLNDDKPGSLHQHLHMPKR